MKIATFDGFCTADDDLIAAYKLSTFICGKITTLSGCKYRFVYRCLRSIGVVLVDVSSIAIVYHRVLEMGSGSLPRKGGGRALAGYTRAVDVLNFIR